MSDMATRASSRIRVMLDRRLARFDLQAARRSSLDEIGWNDPAWAGRFDQGATVDQSRLDELRRRYSTHPAAATSLWSEEFQQKEIELSAFRADNAYLWQRRDAHLPIRYGLTALYARLFDPLALWGRFDEDGAFGAHVVDIDDELLSRDLLDSIIELNFLEEALVISRQEHLKVLDIGAGYGRLAHRATAALPNLEYICTDGVALSTVICETYLRYRHVERSRVVPLDEIEAVVEMESFGLAVNVHSFSECPIKVIEWWAGLLAKNRVPYLFVVPSGGFRSQELSSDRIDYLPVLSAAGYNVVTRRPKYAHSTFVQRYGIFPTEHALLQLDAEKPEAR